MIKIYFTGSGFYVPTVVVDNEINDDLIAILDELHERCELPVPLHEPQELIEEGFDLDDYIPINGGEYYIDMVERVEELL